MKVRGQEGVVSVQGGLFSFLSSVGLLVLMFVSIDLSGWNARNDELEKRAQKLAARASTFESEAAAREFVFNETQNISTRENPVIGEVLFPRDQSGRQAVEVRLYGEYRALTSGFLSYLRDKGGVFDVEKTALAKLESKRGQPSCSEISDGFSLDTSCSLR